MPSGCRNASAPGERPAPYETDRRHFGEKGPERVRELKTWVSEETGPEATIDALMSVTAYFRISRDRARAILAEVEGAVATWRTQGRALGMTAGELDAFAEAFEHEERDAARRVIG